MRGQTINYQRLKQLLRRLACQGQSSSNGPQTCRNGHLLKPGSVHSNGSEMIFQLASNLKNHGKPLLVISRKSREELMVNFNIPAENSLWLSQKDGEGVQFVDIDG